MPDQNGLPSGFELTRLDPEFRQNPHPRLTALREQCPVHRDPLLGAFFVTRYDDARSILTDRTMWRTAQRAEPEANILHARLRNEPTELVQMRDGGEVRNIIFMENPDHARVRPPLQKALYARVAKCKPDVEKIVGRVLDGFEDRDSVDLIEELCVPVPVMVIAHILGVDEGRFHEFRDWSEGLIQSLNMMRTPEQTAHYVRAVKALVPFFEAEIASRRKEPRDDLISDIIDAIEHGTEISDHEILHNLMGFLVAGNLTTTDLIGNGIYLFLTHPDQLAKLTTDWRLLGPAIEEVLRYEPPVDGTIRVASHDLEMHGCHIRQSQAILTSFPAANRDPRVFAQPDVFDITREAKPHMSFGGGAHICIGAPLARLEAQVVFRMLFERFPRMRHAGDAPVWKATPAFHGLERLPVSLK
jgi:cytochrome P450